MSDTKKIWTYEQMRDKVREDLDIEEEDPDESFIKASEMIGYFNEAISEAESEIMTLNEDYFLTSDYVPLVSGTSEYDMPENIFLNKLRGVVYSSGATIYPVKKFKPYNKFHEIALANYNGASDDYRYYLTNPTPGSIKFNIIPAARETATLPPLSSTSTPMIRWYIRNANRIPYVGDYTNEEDILPASVNTSTNIITVDPLVAYVTGDAVKFTVLSGNTLPSPLVVDTVYYVIAVSSTTIKLATSAANASAGTAIDLTTTGTNYFSMKVAATTAIVEATLIDIPECSTFIMEWVKANCLLKDGDPRIQTSIAKLEQQRKMLQDTLAEAIPDNDNTVDGDFSAYWEMS